MHYQDYLIEALEIVSAWDLPDADFAKAVNDQAKLMAGVPPRTDLGEVLRIAIAEIPIQTLPLTLPLHFPKVHLRASENLRRTALVR
jgi:hypothetical protein